MCSPTRVIVDADVDVDLGSKLVHPSKNFSELLALEGGNLQYFKRLSREWERSVGGWQLPLTTRTTDMQVLKSRDDRKDTVVEWWLTSLLSHKTQKPIHHIVHFYCTKPSRKPTNYKKEYSAKPPIVRKKPNTWWWNGSWEFWWRLPYHLYCCY